jgi:hypothetical protein
MHREGITAVLAELLIDMEEEPAIRLMVLREPYRMTWDR